MGRPRSTARPVFLPHILPFTRYARVEPVELGYQGVSHERIARRLWSIGGIMDSCVAGIAVFRPTRSLDLDPSPSIKTVL